MRIVTRGDLDGTMCTVLLKQVEDITDMLQAHPKDMQDQIVDIRFGDIICNLPYHPACSMWFDHHASETVEGRQPGKDFAGAYDPDALSAARLVYEHYVGDHPALKRHESFLDVVDRMDSAQLTLTDVAYPQGAVLLCFLIDPRTGLGRYRHYRISNKEMTDMMPDLLIKMTVEEVLKHPDVRERADTYWKLHAETEEVFTAHSRREGNVIISDFRGLDEIPPGNRFLVYTLESLREGNISVRIQDAKFEDTYFIALGHNIFKRDSQTHVGELLAEYGGGGHKGAGTCQVKGADTERVIAEIIDRVKEE
jgi:nanoRNase/pAp phosphatase (c-di-AMP/oligoRNAs hydrolase)